ncbi:hypothetical protein LXL04_024626 [Taraxacum kok-saghyz]
MYGGRFFLSLYVDNMIITGDDHDESLKRDLSYRFTTKDLGLLRYFLGIEVAQSSKGYLLSQTFILFYKKVFTHTLRQARATGLSLRYLTARVMIMGTESSPGIIISMMFPLMKSNDTRKKIRVTYRDFRFSMKLTGRDVNPEAINSIVSPINGQPELPLGG